MRRELLFAVMATLLISGCVEWQKVLGNQSASNVGGNNSVSEGSLGAVVERTVPKNSSWKYVVVLPPDYKRERSYPLIVGLHGSGGSAMDYANDWREEAGKNEFIFAFPQSPDTQGWDIRTVNAFVMAVVDDARANYNITNLYLTGHSAGAHMTVTIALLNPVFRGVAQVDGALPPWYCPPDMEYCKEEYTSKYGGCTCGEGQRFYMLNGQNDGIVTPADAKEAKNELERCGVNVTQRFLPNHGHEYPKEENANIMAWFISLENDRNMSSIKCKSP
jgi:predicted esterase